MKHNILVVDDNPTDRRVIREVCDKLESFTTLEASNGKDAIKKIHNDFDNIIKLILLDINMPGMGGAATLKAIKETRPEIPVIIVTASNEIDDAIHMTKLGAFDYIVKPVPFDRLELSIRNAIQFGNLKHEVSEIKKTVKAQVEFKSLIGHNGDIKACIKLGEKAAHSNIPVLITGESGVGKEIFARAIHGESNRVGKPFVAINCGAIPENLAESILFGHKEGAFTGASSTHKGKFREADNGTIFLDEVGELPAHIQVKLLRVLQEGEIEPVGGDASEHVNVRVISATNRNMKEEVRQGRFREDLFYRLNVFPVTLPPLRDRKNDIQALVNFFINRYNAIEDKAINKVNEKAMTWIKEHDWLGNVRELENVISRAIVLCESNTLTLDDLTHTSISNVSDQKEEAEEVRSAPIPTPHNSITLHNHNNRIKTMEQIEHEVIASMLELCDHNINETAAKLNIGTATIYRKLKKMKQHA